MNKVNNKQESIVWTISLLGFPIFFFIILLTQVLTGGLDANKYSYIIIMSSFFILSMLATINIIFVFYTIRRFRKNLSVKEIFFYLLGTTIANVIWAYVVANIWSKNNLNIYSFKNKEIFSFASILLYISFIFSILLPSFIASMRWSN